MNIIHQVTYTRYEELGELILGTLAKQISKHGYYENLGQNEARTFNDKMMEAFSAGKLSYEEAVQLSTDFSEGVSNL